MEYAYQPGVNVLLINSFIHDLCHCACFLCKCLSTLQIVSTSYIYIVRCDHASLSTSGLFFQISDIRISYNSQRDIPKFIASIAVALVPKYGEHWLA